MLNQGADEPTQIPLMVSLHYVLQLPFQAKLEIRQLCKKRRNHDLPNATEIGKARQSPNHR